MVDGAGRKISEGKAGFRRNRSCVRHVYALGKIIRGRKDAGRKAYCFFLDVQKAYDTAWRNGPWKKSWEIGIRGKMWRVMNNMTECAMLVNRGSKTGRQMFYT